MKKRKLFKAISMILIITILVTSVSVIGFAKGNTVETYAIKPSVSPEECDCYCHGIKLPDDLTNSKEGIAVLPIYIISLAPGYGLGLLLKQIEWFFTFQWHCKCGKPHFEGLKDYSQS